MSPETAELIARGEAIGTGKVTIPLDRLEAERVRDLLTVELARRGFREDYSASKRGRMLEQLIDRFFIP